MKVENKTTEMLVRISKLLVSSGLVPEGLEKENLNLFYNVDDLNQLTGVIGIEIYGKACLLRSLAVREDKRNLGIARNLLSEALDFARASECYDTYLLTETIGSTMARYGFKDVSRDEVPQDILNSPFFNGICPCSCQIMYKNIKEW